MPKRTASSKIRRKSDQPIGEVLKEYLEAYRHRGRFTEARIKAIWADKMPTTIRQYTRDVKLIKQTVYLAIDSAPLRDQLTFQRDKIKDMLNGELGEAYVEKVVVR